MPKGSPYKDALDVAILTLQEKGRLYINKQKWWKEKHGGGKCKVQSAYNVKITPTILKISLLFVFLHLTIKTNCHTV